MKIPLRKNIKATNVEDPLDFYYLFGIRRFYLKRLKMALPLLAGPYANLLEIGYGSGILFPELASRCAKLYGVDTHEQNRLVEEMMEKEGIKAELVTGNILHLPYEDGKFDGVVCLSVLEHIADLEQAVTEIKRVLSEQGTAVIGFPVKNKITDFLFRLVGFDHSKHHVSNHRVIMDKLSQHLIVEKTVRFPALLPLDYSLYKVVKCRKSKS
jgi:ubiquinone/menaquinone biosynthesis C-methylase UbiE